MNRPAIPRRVLMLGEVFQQRAATSVSLMKEALFTPTSTALKAISRANDGMARQDPSVRVR